MRQFQKILQELKDVVAQHKLGTPLVLPSLLPSVEVNGHRMTYAPMGLDQSEDQPAVVFLHGFGGFFMDWPRVMAPVSRHTRVYALDLPGWGFSELNPAARGLEDDIAAVRGFIEALNLKRVILCGISYGAGVAWGAAAMGMPRVARAVLLNPMPPYPLEHMKSALYQGIFALNLSRAMSVVANKTLRKSHYKLICRESLLNDRLLDTFYLDLAFMVIKQPKIPFILNAHARGARQIDWADWEHRLAGCATPVSILQALNDRIFTLDSAQRLHDLIPNSELIEVPDCGHAMVFDQHKKVSEFIIQCLERDGARGREKKGGRDESAQEDLRKKLGT